MQEYQILAVDTNFRDRTLVVDMIPVDSNLPTRRVNLFFDVGEFRRAQSMSINTLRQLIITKTIERSEAILEEWDRIEQALQIIPGSAITSIERTVRSSGFNIGLVTPADTERILNP